MRVTLHEFTGSYRAAAVTAPGIRHGFLAVETLLAGEGSQDIYGGVVAEEFGVSRIFDGQVLFRVVRVGV